MSDGLIKLFDDFAEGLEKRNVNKIVDLFTEDATYIVYAKGYEPVKGKRAIRAFMESECAKVKDYSVEKLYVCEKKNCIMVEWRVRFTDVASNKRLEIQGISIIEAENGRIRNWREYIQTI